jgi:hypothetical protein
VRGQPAVAGGVAGAARARAQGEERVERLPVGDFIGDTELRFLIPASAEAGPAFVEVLNPPFIPFSSSGNDPDGAFTFR